MIFRTPALRRPRRPSLVLPALLVVFSCGGQETGDASVAVGPMGQPSVIGTPTGPTDPSGPQPVPVSSPGGTSTAVPGPAAPGTGTGPGMGAGGTPMVPGVGGTPVSNGGQGGSSPGVAGQASVAGQSSVGGRGGAPVVPVDPGPAGDGFYELENLDRGVVAVEADDGVYVGWRMFGFEYRRGSPDSVSYNVYRDGEMVANVTDSTNYQDAQGTGASQYSVSAVIDGAEGSRSSPVAVWGENYLRVPLNPPDNAHHASDASAADLDADGEYEIIQKWEANNSQDNANSGVTDNVLLEGIKLDGTSLWRVDLGPNIRAGAHYTQFIVYDFDGDGSAEMAVKTAPGTRDASGDYLSMGPAANDDDSQVYRNGDGYVLSGPEYLTVFDGETGTELATVDFDHARGNVGDWGDTYGNRVDRFLATAAYLDDTGLASFVMARGYYTRSTLTAWNFRDGELTRIWKFDSEQAGNQYTGQGAHSISVANVDDDPQQEIIYGAMTVDHDGTAQCNTQLNHGDALHASDFLPDRPGIEVFMPHEYEARPQWSLRDGATCEILQQGTVTDDDVGRGVAADVDPNNPGAELWSSNGVPLTSAATGQRVADAPGSINFLAWWDADESREVEDGTSVTKVGGGTLVSCGECSSNNGTKSTPNLVADLLGDWREEVVWRESNNAALRIYTTTDVASRRIYTLMHDAQYRIAISWQNVAYNQPPHPSFHIGADMAEPPVPDMHVK